MLLVEDNAIELRVVRTMLTKKLKIEEQNVEFCTDGISAYNKIK
jgi:CheY-like chemotaxis protein